MYHLVRRFLVQHACLHHEDIVRVFAYSKKPSRKTALRSGESLKEGNAVRLTWTPLAPPDGRSLPAMINTVGEDMRPVETPMDTTAAFRYSVSERGNIITRTYRVVRGRSPKEKFPRLFVHATSDRKAAIVRLGN